MRMRSRNRRDISPSIFALSTLIGVLAIVGCGTTAGNVSGNGSTNDLPAMVISLTADTTPIITQDGVVSITASVANDPSNQGVTWTLDPSSADGVLGDMTPTSVVFSAPGNIAAPEYVTIFATSVADSAKTASMTITLKPSPTVAAQAPAPDPPTLSPTATMAFPSGGGMRVVRPPAGTPDVPVPDHN